MIIYETAIHQMSVEFKLLQGQLWESLYHESEHIYIKSVIKDMAKIERLLTCLSKWTYDVVIIYTMLSQITYNNALTSGKEHIYILTDYA